VEGKYFRSSGIDNKKGMPRGRRTVYLGAYIVTDGKAETSEGGKY